MCAATGSREQEYFALSHMVADAGRSRSSEASEIDFLSLICAALALPLLHALPGCLPW